MPLAFPSSHSKCLSCRLAVWFFHRTFHSSESCTEGSLAWTAPGLWSLEVGAGSSVILLSTGCCETSLTALVLADSKGYVSFSDSFTCHYPIDKGVLFCTLSRPPPILSIKLLKLNNSSCLISGVLIWSKFLNGIGLKSCGITTPPISPGS